MSDATVALLYDGKAFVSMFDRGTADSSTAAVGGKTTCRGKAIEVVCRGRVIKLNKSTYI